MAALTQGARRFGPNSKSRRTTAAALSESAHPSGVCSTSAVYTLLVRATYKLHSTSAVYTLPVRACTARQLCVTQQVRATYILHSTSAVYTLRVRATYILHSMSAVPTLSVRATYMLHSTSAVHTLPGPLTHCPARQLCTLQVRATYMLHSTSAVPTVVGQMLWKQRELIQHRIRRIATIASVKQGAALTSSVSLNAGGLRSNSARTVGASSFPTGTAHSSLIAPLRTPCRPYRSFVAWKRKLCRTAVPCRQPNPNPTPTKPSPDCG